MNPRPWSKQHACCVDCGTSERRHQAHGLCTRCYNRYDYHQHLQERRASNRHTNQAFCQRHRERINERASARWYRRKQQQAAAGMAEGDVGAE